MTFIKHLFLALLFLTSAFAQRERNEIIISNEPPLFNSLLPRSVHGNFLAGRTASITKDASSASVYWRAAYRQEPNNPVLLERAFIASISDGSFDMAFPLAERIIALDKSHRLARLTMMVKAAKVAQFKTARTHLNAMQKSSGDFVSILLSAWIQTGNNEASEGLKGLEKLSKEPLIEIFKHYHSGLIQNMAGMPKEAGVSLAEAYKIENSLLRVTDAYGRWLSSNSTMEEAQKVYNAFEAVIPAHPLITQARKGLDSGFTLQPLIINPTEGIAEVFTNVASVYSRNNGDEIAALYMQLARYLDPANDLNTLTLAENYQSAKNFYKSLALYKEVKPTSPLYVNAQTQMGYDLDASEKKDEAIRHLEKLALANPENTEVLQAQGNILRHRKLYTEAVSAYSKAIALITKPEPKHWVLFYYRAMSSERAKEWALAEKDFKQAIALIPENHTNGRAQLFNYLGYSYVDYNMNIEEGLTLIREAIKLAPSDAQIIDSLGWAYYKLNRYEEAVVELEKALDIKADRRGETISYSDDPTLNDHLGDAYWYVGRRIEAQFQWKKAKDLKPEPEELEKILKKIKDGLPEVRAAK